MASGRHFKQRRLAFKLQEKTNWISSKPLSYLQLDGCRFRPHRRQPGIHSVRRLAHTTVSASHPDVLTADPAALDRPPHLASVVEKGSRFMHGVTSQRKHPQWVSRMDRPKFDLMHALRIASLVISKDRRRAKKSRNFDEFRCRSHHIKSARRRLSNVAMPELRFRPMRRESRSTSPDMSRCHLRQKRVQPCLCLRLFSVLPTCHPSAIISCHHFLLFCCCPVGETDECQGPALRVRTIWRSRNPLPPQQNCEISNHPCRAETTRTPCKYFFRYFSFISFRFCAPATAQPKLTTLLAELRQRESKATDGGPPTDVIVQCIRRGALCSSHSRMTPLSCTNAGGNYYACARRELDESCCLYKLSASSSQCFCCPSGTNTENTAGKL